MNRYREMRLEMGAGNSTPRRRQEMVEALRRFSTEYTWPFRIVLGNIEADEKPVFDIVLNHGGQGHDEGIWEMHGWHREMDVVRLTVICRNLYYSGHKFFEEFGELASGYEDVMDNVVELMRNHQETDEE